MKGSARSFIAANRRIVLFIGVLTCLVGFGFIAWQTGARESRIGISPNSAQSGREDKPLKTQWIRESLVRGSDDVDSTGKMEGPGVEDADQLDDDARDSPPDTTSYWRQAIPEDHIKLPDAPSGVTSTVVDLVVNNTDAALKNSDTFNDGETNIAVNPANPNEIVITAFSGGWGSNAPSAGSVRYSRLPLRPVV